MTEERDLYIVLTRLEGKIDTSLAIHGGDIEKLKTQNADHENRIRLVEGKSTVSASQLWAGLVGAVAVAAGIASFIRNIFPV